MKRGLCRHCSLAHVIVWLNQKDVKIHENRGLLHTKTWQGQNIQVQRKRFQAKLALQF